MRKLCLVCKGKGTINNPVPSGPMGYCEPNGESWPQVVCPNCGGSGLVGVSENQGPVVEKPQYTFCVRNKDNP